MDASSIPSLFSSLQIPSNHTSVGLSNLVASNAQTKALFHHKRLPDDGWTDIQIQRLLLELSVLDTNCEETVKCQVGGTNTNTNTNANYPHRWTGAGEREGRIYSSLVSSRHFGFGHGIGRSGDVMEAQPKAVGSSALLRLTLRLCLDAVRRGAGLEGEQKKKSGVGNGPASFGTLLPVCTGMSMALVLSGLRDRAQQQQPSGTIERNIVLWSRIDQKSCYKAILSAGLKCIVLPTTKNPQTDEVSTDLQALQKALDIHGHSILAVITTTSCFCPRVPDQVDDVAKLIQKWNSTNQHTDAGDDSTINSTTSGISHVINHAYGLQCQVTNKLLNRACTLGRVDAIICSTDKNFLVPVGGALILSPHSCVIDAISKNYPGRASASPMMDLFITLLSMGLNGYKGILAERRRLVGLFREKLELVAKGFGERVLDCPRNTISFGITLDHLVTLEDNITTTATGTSTKTEADLTTTQQTQKQLQKEQNLQITKFGSMLFTRCISGTRIVPCNETKTISGHTFQGFGSSHDNFPHAYMTAACAVGMGEAEMNDFFIRLEKSWKDYCSKREKERRKKNKQQLLPTNENLEEGLGDLKI